MAKLFPAPGVDTVVLNRRPGVYQKMVTLFDVAVAIPATPGTVLIDEEVDLAPWGLVATTYRYGNFGFFFEKPDGQGGWIPVTADDSSAPPPWVHDPPGYEIACEIIPSPVKRPKYPGGDPTPFTTEPGGSELGASMGKDWDNRAGCRIELGGLGGPPPEQTISRVRIVAARSTKTYTPEEQALINTYGYRLRVILHAINLVAWEKEVPILATQGVELMHETVDLSQYGLVSDTGHVCFIAELRRNGRTIRTYLPREFTPGEELDHPALPVKISTVGVMPGNSWRSDNNGQNPWWGSKSYGRNGDAGAINDTFIAWTHIGPPLGYCPESTKQIIHVVAWRAEDDGPAAYYDGTLAEGTIDLSVFHPAMGGTLKGLTAIPADVFVTFVPTTAPNQDSTKWTVHPTASVQPRYMGMCIEFIPGVTTLQEVFDAIDAASATGGHVRTDTLVAPNYVLTQTSEFTLTTAGTIVDPAIPTTPEGAAGATLRVRMLIAPPNRKYEYPFVVTEDASPRFLALPRIPVPPSVEAIPQGLWWAGAYPTPPVTPDYDRLMLHQDGVAMLYDVPYFTQEYVGTGAPQTIPHGVKVLMGWPPYDVVRHRVIPVKWPGGSACDFSSSFDTKNIYVTMTIGVTYIVAWWQNRYGF